MNEDVTQIIEELTKLYDDGKSVIANFEHAYDVLVPDRHELFANNFQMNHYGMLEKVKPAPKPQHYQTDKVVAKLDTFAKTWIQSVNDLLAQVPQTRFRLQFNDPNQKYTLMSKLGETTRTEERLFDGIYDLATRHAELRQIIIELERTAEQIQPVDTKNIEPATYDRAKRTIFFADEAIRFRKNAEYSPAICELMFAKPDKQWEVKDFQKLWDSLYDYIGLEKPSDWNRVYDVIKKMNSRIQRYTDIGDLFLTDTKTVRLNPKYIAPTKNMPK